MQRIRRESPTALTGLGLAAKFWFASRFANGCKKRLFWSFSTENECLLTSDRDVAAGDEVSKLPEVSLLRLRDAFCNQGFLRDIMHKLLSASVQLEKLSIKDCR